MSGLQPGLPGAILIIALVVWVVLSEGLASGGSSADAIAVAGVVAGMGLTLIAARTVARRAASVPATAIIVAAAGVAALRHDAVLDSPISQPLGYANATAAFFVQAAAAGLLLTAVVRHPAARLVGLLIAVLCAVVPWVNGSLAGSLLVIVLFTGLAGHIGPRAGRAVIATGAGLFCIVFVITVTLGARAHDDADNRRIRLWHDAAELLAEHPLVGVGPGRFAEQSPTARSDLDARWAHHEFLELGAETGVPGFTLAVIAVIWGFGLLWSAPPARAAIGAMALAAFAIHACVDYVAHFPAVPLATAAVVGAASAPRRDRSTTVPPCTGGP